MFDLHHTIMSLSFIITLPLYSLLCCFKLLVLFKLLMKEQGGNNQRKQFHKRGHPNNRGSQRPQPAVSPNPKGEEGQGFKKRFIKKNKDGKGKPEKGGKKEERDLDRELRDYWITSKGQTADGNAVDIAKQKLNSEMDEYWKNKKQQPKPE